MQRLLRKARWDPDKVRDDTREYVIEHRGKAGAFLEMVRVAQALSGQGKDFTLSVSMSQRTINLNVTVVLRCVRSG